ncbi:putative NBD/HSP70 family sugar kinase [Haloactinopolyspora alba]|uniref:Putative NBD/HSP70 family sugar kinase n=1 Tax=Haloactinopolyspora alba TaxID=648780 RepID=A0A2P8E916_9ACTN|nr:ROK family transcriptional regulator [Haloactinopolyspora alba]PSL05887.1 putative NBD/HSP70 family sugar kinase [Haloactinopolyspora alba]
MPAGGVGSQGALRAANRRLVLDALLESGALIQADLARRTGLSAATVSTIVHDLTAEGLLRIQDTVSSGRRARAVSLRPDAGVAVGIDIGRRHVRVVLADLSHTVLAEEESQAHLGAPASEHIALVRKLFDALLSSTGVERSAVVGVGAGLPGPIDVRDGQVGSASILPEWIGVNAAEALGDALGMPVSVDNDANLGVLAEATWGAARGHRDAVYLKIGTGVGAGLIIGGEPHRGAIGLAGEIGHLTMDENGQVCRCGNRGCLETTASSSIVLDLLARSHGDDLTVADAVAAAHGGDVACRRVIGDVGRHAGVAVANLCNLINPGIIVVGGQLAAAGEVLMDPLREAFARYAIPSVGASTQVTTGSLGRGAQSMGAVALALQSAERHLLAGGSR